MPIRLIENYEPDDRAWGVVMGPLWHPSVPKHPFVVVEADSGCRSCGSRRVHKVAHKNSVDGGWGFVTTFCEDCKRGRSRYPVAREPKWASPSARRRAQPDEEDG